MKIAVSGANGQLGNEIRLLTPKFKNHEFLFTDVGEVDISNKKAVEKFFAETKPDFVVNCAAYTAVDKAETEPELAKKINADAVKNLAQACNVSGAFLIHVSTDYVFDGEATRPYCETDTVNPQSVYGKTKLEGEQNALKYCAKSMVIRTSWLYSSFGKNFVKTMLHLGASKNEVSVVADQFGSPTYASDLALAILNIIEISANDKQKFVPGIYHYANEGETTWHEFTQAIFKARNLNCKVIPLATHEYPTLAKRPKYSVLNKSKIKKIFNLTIPFWKDSLELCVEKLKNE